MMEVFEEKLLKKMSKKKNCMLYVVFKGVKENLGQPGMMLDSTVLFCLGKFAIQLYQAP